MRLHLALQAATLAVAVSHAPGMCSAVRRRAQQGSSWDGGCTCCLTEVRATCEHAAWTAMLAWQLDMLAASCVGMLNHHFSSGMPRPPAVPPPRTQCYPGAAAGPCFRSSAVTAALFGYVLPTAGLRYIEQRSRAAFASLLRSAAALQHPSQHMLSATILR